MSDEPKTPNQAQQVVMTLGDLQVVLNYLASRPYSEVFNVIETIKKAKTLDAVLAEQKQQPDAEPEKAG